MAYQARAVAGTRLQMSASSPVSYSTIKGVSGFQGPTGTKGTIDVTAIDDTSKQYLADLPDYGNITFDLFWSYEDTNHIALKTAFDTVGSTTYFQILAGTGTPGAGGTGACQGEVTGWEHDFSKGNAMTVKVTVKLSGPITWS